MQALEIIARAIDDRSGFALSGCMDAMMRHDADMNEAASAIVAALEAGGYAIVPFEPSGEMVFSGVEAWCTLPDEPDADVIGIYRAMIAAKDI